MNAARTPEGLTVVELTDRPGLSRYITMMAAGLGGATSMARFSGLDYPAALALIPDGLDRELVHELLRQAEFGLCDADAKRAAEL